MKLFTRAEAPKPGDIMARAGDLKREVVAYARAPEFRLDLLGAAAEFGRDEIDVDVTDYFIHKWVLGDGQTILERFAGERLGLSDADREIVLGWMQGFEGLFDVVRADGDAIIAVNVFNDIDYRIRSNRMISASEIAWEGHMIATRIVPLGDDWMLSGMMRRITPSMREDVYNHALQNVLENKDQIFRNPKLLERGWELQREDRRHFIAFFGSDTVIIPRSNLEERFAAFERYRYYEARSPAGTTAEERARVQGGVIAAPAMMSFADFPREVETIGIVHDETCGCLFLPDFGMIADLFAFPELAENDAYLDVLAGYLDDDTIPPEVIKRLVKRHPGTVDRVFRIFCDDPLFTWVADGEALLRECKGDQMSRDRQPSFVPLSDRLSAYGRSHRGALAGVKVGRNDPCSCGSGKKYKKCCGA